MNYPALAFGISEDKVIGEIDSSEEEAINFLYDRCKDDFRTDFIKFANKTEEYSKLSSSISNYITESFIPMLKKI